MFRTIYDRTNVELRSLFWGYAVVAIAIFLEQLFIAPTAPYGRERASDEDSEPTERSPLLSPSADSSFARIQYDPDRPKRSDAVVGAMEGLPVSKQVGSSWFALLSVFFVLHMLRINLYLATAHSQLDFYTGDAQLADRLTKAFTLLLPLAGIASIPLVGTLLDHRPSRDVFLVITVLTALFGGLSMARSSTAQIIGIVSLVVLRPLMYTSISDIWAKLVGFEHFGTVYGLCNTIAGLFGLVQRPLDALIQTRTGYTPVNLALGIACACASLAVVARTMYH